MVEIRLTAGNDTFAQPVGDRATWHTVFGGAGDDTLRVYVGAVLGQQGNDRIERLVHDAGPRQPVRAAYDDSPAGVVVNLAQGWAEDGWGTRDTLVGVDGIIGSRFGDVLVGDADDNEFFPGPGSDRIDGGGGVDLVYLPATFQPGPGQAWRTLLLSDIDIDVSADGRSALIRLISGSGLAYTLTDVETLVVQAVPDAPAVRLQLADLITRQTMAEDVIAAGPAFRWNAAAPLGSPATVTFSFVATAPDSGPGAAGFRPFSPAEQQLVRDVLARTSALTGLGFVEVADSAPGQMRFGVSQQANTKGISWLPGQPGAGDNAGDVWMDVESMQGIAPGTAGHQALLHEIGHALGLRHPRNIDPGEHWPLQLREQDDRAAFTVMSQAPALDDVVHRDWGLLDVLALRHLYGSRGVATGDDVYRLTSAHAGVQTTLVDDGGIDTLDASGLDAGVRLSLVPGSLSDVGTNVQGRLGVDNLAIVDGSLIEHAIGTVHDDVIIGNDGDNRIVTGGGNDFVDGGRGLDTAVLPGPRAAYGLSIEFGSTVFSALDGRSGFVELTGIERVHFTDTAVAFDLGGHAGAVAQIIRALFGKEHLANPVFVGIGLQLMDAGVSYAQLVELAIGTPVFEQLAGGRSNEAFVNAVYRNVVGIAPDAQSLALYTGLLDSGSYSQAALGLLASQLPLNTGSVELVGLAQTGIEYWPAG